ncbi:SWIM zinc finger family protein [Synechococcus elongatus]|uniref:SWIM-type domain-containing protein n=1 Tax=Synechococcus elongatus (strain ATCC 33912 / PCC 7942 / FACHB-805) TaxID=1140 RepID=Q31NI1_SYNE7|nr:SWIM zinc finger family protein [Synechococcus elongatus]ABB57388.1 conserved hypothetical protein [Synechococcus elongatus PCC 7942 = FACHB-805]AJD58106.1 hypothetical protein M744_09825 [Synechococcus elongatus UTEX 2973]MBD2587795.1 SWIM zinc finger family protein [Synechococcus elongatus FACHB-242]MBD2688426.1 SWIM zinc finger family protein [Synechococcus elongatus FACHB-1061]MBD2707497.1 SWIM zinc finger family protein [Synechococcus elongatus PCC 7942 = FACHB-805]
MNTASDPWWVQQWLDLINAYRFKKRLERGWRYAREGHVLSICFQGQKVEAKVQGTEAKPYRVSLWLDPISEEDWGYVISALATEARWSALLLAGEMPADIETVFARNGLRLFPFSLSDVHSRCSCPDKANPCKHVSAIYYLLGDRFSEDPFVLFQLRGRQRQQLLEELRSRRQASLQPTPEVSAAPVPQLQQFWDYADPLDPELVIITPSLGDTVLGQLGSLPLASDPRLETSAAQLLVQLRQLYEDVAQSVFLESMASAGDR